MTDLLITESCFQDEYKAEGIIWQNIEFIDNSGCLELLSKKPTGLLQLLDEECKYVLLSCAKVST